MSRQLKGQALYEPSICYYTRDKDDPGPRRDVIRDVKDSPSLPTHARAAD